MQPSTVVKLALMAHFEITSTGMQLSYVIGYLLVRVKTESTSKLNVFCCFTTKLDIKLIKTHWQLLAIDFPSWNLLLIAFLYLCTFPFNDNYVCFWELCPFYMYYYHTLSKSFTNFQKNHILLLLYVIILCILQL